MQRFKLCILFRLFCCVVCGGTALGARWVRFGIAFVLFWGKCRIVLGSCWNHFEIALGPLSVPVPLWVDLGLLGGRFAFFVAPSPALTPIGKCRDCWHMSVNAHGASATATATTTTTTTTTTATTTTRLNRRVCQCVHPKSFRKHMFSYVNVTLGVSQTKVQI